ncbi:MAG: ABC transporter substrate-binding protein [Candidatus Nanopelagicales bacterium]
MRRKRLLAVGACIASASFVLAACGSDDGGGGSTEGAQPPANEALTELGDNEGELRVLAWPGYAEDGTQYKNHDWVTPFEQDSGCDVSVTTFGTSDDSFTKMDSGQYDVISASGDASRRLIYAGLVDPVNVDLIPSYGDIFDDLKDKPWNTVDGVHYGVPHGRGANLLMYNTEMVKPSPTSWAETWDANSPYKGKITAYDNPIFIADAALYLKATQPDLGIENPYALDETQLEAAKQLLIQQRDLVGEYWDDALVTIQSFVDENIVLGTTWQYNANAAKLEGSPVDAILPSEGSTGWSDTWMVAHDSPNVNCAYAWMNYITSPGPNAEVAEWFGEAPANSKSCDLTVDKNHCKIYHADDPSYWDQVYYWETPTPDCADGRADVECTDYADWKLVWDEVRSKS